ncbi:MAG: flagellar basal body rod protein FlgB [Desulfovibrionaceae bacterium]|jgi:flagellar basal-body rod protein FlgB|nr:flagellar basal body rod protein FlgB [Desulfovibrionaceae bacterium]
MKGLFASHLDLTAKVMDMRLKRQNVVMSNLANMETPNYKPRRLEFEEDLQKALNLDSRGKMSKTSGGHMPAVFDAGTFGPEWVKDFKPRMTWGEDNLDLDKEMTTLAKNTMMYNALVTVIKKNFDGMKQIITEGSK